jgi:hypothetical protein
MAEYAVTEEAALIILLHASKHPSSAVNGVLLGKQRSGDGWTITTAIPLFHRSHVIAPCVETALTQVRGDRTVLSAAIAAARTSVGDGQCRTLLMLLSRSRPAAGLLASSYTTVKSCGSFKMLMEHINSPLRRSSVLSKPHTPPARAHAPALTHHPARPRRSQRSRG